MFTGLILSMGTVRKCEPVGGDLRLQIQADDLPLSSYAEGESIAVSGVCLTALSIDANCFWADVSRETLALTTLGDWQPGTRVNLEPSLALGDRMGGHLVTGHIDGRGRIAEIQRDARSTRLKVEVPEVFSHYIARKGSVAIDGISLTVNAATAARFDVNIIPHTWEQTNLSGAKLGGEVNIEVDLMARYLERFAESHRTESSLNREFLEKHGYER